MDQLIHLLIVDDHPALLYGLAGLFKDSPDIEIVGEARDGIMAIELACKLDPDVILMDLALPQKSGLETIREIRKAGVKSRILVFSASAEGHNILAALQGGAIGFLTKDSSPKEIILAIQKTYNGEPVLKSFLEQNLIHSLQNPLSVEMEETGIIENLHAETLTNREKEILRWLSLGLSNQQIATRACITETTVRSHISNLFQKLNIHNRAQAVVYALKTGLIDLEEI
jgi:DNA-binding NarL/FixJ family response regulator